MLNPRPTYEEYKKEIRAHALTTGRLRNGLIKKPKKCEECSKKGKIVSHHPDYDKPLLIQWLCPKCHSQYRRDRKKPKELSVQAKVFML